MEAIASSMGIVAYLALFFGVGLLFVFANLLIGRFVRANDPHAEKVEIYECGEPTIGTSYVQFDLRFYVVALLFIIFDVEVAFFFPWAVIYGKANNMRDETFQVVEADTPGMTESASLLYKEMGVRNPALPTTVPATLMAGYKNEFGAAPTTALTDEEASFVVKSGSQQLLFATLFDIGVFFAVLLTGFAYVWKRGDLDWVRSMSQEKQRQMRKPLERDQATSQETVLTL